MQKVLESQQISAFYHDNFVQEQVKHFTEIAQPALAAEAVVVDIGGGCGYFANAISKELKLNVRVIDMDPVSVKEAKKVGLDAMLGDALAPAKSGDEGIVCFNLILHHLVASTELKTTELQSRALSVWQDVGIKIFVNEYIYESWFNNLSGSLIYHVTKSKFLSFFAQVVSKLVPSLRANTFGIGVRFRSNSEWKKLFSDAGFTVVNEVKGNKEYISFPRRLLLIKEIRRDSFLLALK